MILQVDRSGESDQTAKQRESREFAGQRESRFLAFLLYSLSDTRWISPNSVMSAAKAKSESSDSPEEYTPIPLLSETAAEKPRVYTPAELEKEGISLAAHPIGLNMQWTTTSAAENAYVSIQWLQENNFAQYLPADLDEACKENDGEDEIFIAKLKDYKKIPFVTPLCSKIVLGGSAKATVSSVTGVKLWTVLKKIEKM